jgi:hypothetical protein
MKKEKKVRPGACCEMRVIRAEHYSQNLKDVEY